MKSSPNLIHLILISALHLPFTSTVPNSRTIPRYSGTTYVAAAQAAPSAIVRPGPSPSIIGKTQHNAYAERLGSDSKLEVLTLVYLVYGTTSLLVQDEFQFKYIVFTKSGRSQSLECVL